MHSSRNTAEPCLRPFFDQLAARPALAIISHGKSPYGIHLSQRIVRELTEIQLWTLYTHDISMADWKLPLPPEINPVQFGVGENAQQQADPRFAAHEWKKGGRVIRWLRENHIRIVLLFGYNSLGRMRVIRWCRSVGIPCFVWGDSNIKSEASVTGIRAAVKHLVLPWILRRCTGVMPCGSLGVQYFAKYGVPRSQMFLLPCEPDYDLIWQIAPQILSQVRQQFFLEHNRHRIVFSGRLAQVKRVDLLLDAFTAIAAQRPDWDLLIVGDGPLRGELQSRVPTELLKRIGWTGFLDDQKTIGALYRLSDVLVLPSDFEPWALVINEAAAAGLAIVSTDVVGAAAELVRDGVNGRIFPPGDLAALTACLLDVTDPGHIEEMRAVSPRILDEWRRTADPVDGLRQALRYCGVLDDVPRLR